MGSSNPGPLETMHINGSANKDSTPRVSLLQQFVHLPSYRQNFLKLNTVTYNVITLPATIVQVGSRFFGLTAIMCWQRHARTARLKPEFLTEGHKGHKGFWFNCLGGGGS